MSEYKLDQDKIVEIGKVVGELTDAAFPEANTRFVLVIATKKDEGGEHLEMGITANAPDGLAIDLLEGGVEALRAQLNKEKAHGTSLRFLMSLACALTGKKPDEILAEIEADKKEREHKDAGHA